MVYPLGELGETCAFISLEKDYSLSIKISIVNIII